jgi:demethylmenaquinone methyltransferase/2-methoxy-6-polyprenyl-1,4-benzoquinol methylase
MHGSSRPAREPGAPASGADPHAAARALGALDLDTYLGDPTQKQAFVTPMFDVIASRYDDFTRLFSFGMDRRWKAQLLADAAQGPPCSVRVAVDLACGTGDIAFASEQRWPEATVHGIDASSQMIAAAEARRMRTTSRVRFSVGDAMSLPFETGSVDLVTAGYCYRNVPDWRAGLAEAARVLRPGGTLLTLDFFRPTSAAWRSLFLGYLRVAGDAVGWLWHRSPVVYGYIAPSIASFCSAREYASTLRQVGFELPRERRYLGGGVAIHAAVRAG